MLVAMSAQPGITESPWGPEQIESLNAYQAAGVMHPFTCGNGICRAAHRDVLLATPSGWICRHCDYRQCWAYTWMTDGSWRGASRAAMASDYARRTVSGRQDPAVRRVTAAALGEPRYSRDSLYYAFRRLSGMMQAEERDRAEWIEGVKLRLGLVCIGDAPPKKVVYCPGDLPVIGNDYSQPGHPRRVHEDGTLCDHTGDLPNDQKR